MESSITICETALVHTHEHLTHSLYAMASALKPLWHMQDYFILRTPNTLQWLKVCTSTPASKKWYTVFKLNKCKRSATLGLGLGLHTMGVMVANSCSHFQQHLCAHRHPSDTEDLSGYIFRGVDKGGIWGSKPPRVSYLSLCDQWSGNAIWQWQATQVGLTWYMESSTVWIVWHQY